MQVDEPEKESEVAQSADATTPAEATAPPPPRNSSPPQPEPQPTAQMDRPLNVSDALTYLDAVKVQFSDQPDVYNHFLDIMKDFKSQLIDTPGVIKRVSHLFNGHPVLIQGFNTFLPQGYHIECSTDAHDSNFITVTTPTGTTMQTTNDGPRHGPMLWSTSDAAAPATDLQEPSQSPALLYDPSAYMQGPDGAIEPAVEYVRRIKERCDEETYRQFLEILSRYHQTPHTMEENEVFAQISRLFKDEPDLRTAFRVFMPPESQPLFDEFEARWANTAPTTDDRRDRRRDTGAAAPSKKRRRPVEREPVPSKPSGSGSGSKVKKVKTSQDVSSSRRAPPPPEDEGRFFDRVKRALDNQETYNEFLKLVNLFTQGFVDAARLVRDGRNFLGDGDLMRQFKEILGWDDRRERESWMAEQHPAPDGWMRQKIGGGILDRPSRAELSARYGSYRKLPESEVNVTCSGRDDMCRSVLNDEWVSHPTWSSEDSGFIAHKKNAYEEALHRSEEERHEYDFHIEAIVRTIGMLEPISNKIAQLSPEERGNFKLKPNLGGSGKSIHQRVIKKIYGREAGLEVIQAMQDSPALAIPVVLGRLKVKEEEWKRAQREWNKVWREVDARNYHKSLDHQGISFKAADKKAITTKAFVSQIEAAREEQMAKRASLIDPLFARTRPRHQLEFVVDDVSVLQDALKLTFSFLDRTQAQINLVERKKIETFLRSFVPMFFALDAPTFNSAFVATQDIADSEASDDVGSIADEIDVSSLASSSSKAGRSHKKGGGAGDLRKKLLKSEQAKSTIRKTRAQEAASPSSSRMASPAIADTAPVDGAESSANEPSASVTTDSDATKHAQKNVFFSNTVFYTLLRIIEVLYSRLWLFKSIAHKIASKPISHRPNPLAEELGLSLQSQRALMDSTAKPEHFYDLMLESCERLFDNEIEPAAFEDQMRFMFGSKEAYKIFTVDKVIGSLIKQVQMVFSDAKSQDLLDHLKRVRSITSPTTQDLINFRHGAEKILGPDENIFRFDWLPDSKVMTIQLLGKDDASFDDSEVANGRWQDYIDSFVSSGVTPGLTASRIKRPFLRRQVNIHRAANDADPPVVGRGGLEIKVCVRTYRLFFVSNTEDFLWRVHSKEECDQVADSFALRNERRKKKLSQMEEVAAVTS
ncbi:hypothetical protein PLICRDRAFT_105502 [Plicaturopsis crispa FD-325 SS-3]|nr:hypothetical protein PLICRDRAFT_105502 [Plicaturopsis crispa FD-325 SS-3]